MRRKLTKALALFLSMTFVLGTVGCGSATEEAVTNLEVQHNDYRGGILRATTIGENVMKVVSSFKKKNAEIEKNNPNTYWSSKDYQEFVTTFLNNKIIKDTQCLTEITVSWEEVPNYVYGGANGNNSFVTVDSEGSAVKTYPSIQLIRNEKDDYTINNMVTYWNSDNNFNSDMEYNCLYDCNHDWIKTNITYTPSNTLLPIITDGLFEYARIDENSFVIQTENERLYVKFKSAEPNVLLADREIETFFYSKLNGRNTLSDFEPYKEKEISNMTGLEISSETNANNRTLNNIFSKEKNLGEDGTIGTQYCMKHSIFSTIFAKNTVNPFDTTNLESWKKWVEAYCDFTDATKNACSQVIEYTDGNLSVKAYNKLTNYYEQFDFKSDGSSTQSAITTQTTTATTSASK